MSTPAQTTKEFLTHPRTLNVRPEVALIAQNVVKFTTNPPVAASKYLLGWQDTLYIPPWCAVRPSHSNRKAPKPKHTAVRGLRYTNASTALYCILPSSSWIMTVLDASHAADKRKYAKPTRLKWLVWLSKTAAYPVPTEIRQTETVSESVKRSMPAAIPTARVMAGSSTFKTWMKATDSDRYAILPETREIADRITIGSRRLRKKAPFGRGLQLMKPILAKAEPEPTELFNQLIWSLGRCVALAISSSHPQQLQMLHWHGDDDQTDQPRSATRLQLVDSSGITSQVWSKLTCCG